ncbi:MAG TPA: hypothetical protein VGN42_10870 [Pirellulales bacterium]|jgi:hypothetical protein|nr:hypothetical protein [Pirellulales bacterium]
MASSRLPGFRETSQIGNIEDGTMCRRPSPPPGQIRINEGSPPNPRSSRRTKLTLNALSLDRDELVRFLRSVATNVALDKLTVVKGGAKLLDHGTGPFLTIDQVATLEIAGEKTIETADQDRLKKDAFDLASGYMGHLAVALSKGGEAALQFLNDLQRQKDSAAISLNRKFAEVQVYNDKRVDAAKMVLQGLAAIKFGSTITLKTAAMFTGLAGFAIEMGFDVAVKTIDAKSAQDADVVAVVVDNAKQEGEQEAAEKGTEWWHAYITKMDQELQKLSRQANENRLSAKKMGGVTKRLSRAESNAAKAVGSPSAVSAAAKRSKALKWAGKGIGWAFWVNDMDEAWEDLLLDLKTAE